MTDAIEVKTTVRFQPFNVPNYARIVMPTAPRQEGFKETPAIPIEDLEPDVLDALAARWLDNLYAAAKRPSPFAIAKAA
jgi:hypothetical protein